MSAGSDVGASAGTAARRAPFGPDLRMALARPRPLRHGTGQVAGAALALALVGVLGAVEVRTPPSVTVGTFLLLIVLVSTWLFAPAVSALVSAAAACVQLIAWRLGADDIVVAEITVVALVLLTVVAQAAVAAVESYGEALARRNRELLAVNASLENFTNDAAHEFRAPLAVVLSEVDVALARAGSPSDYRRHLEAIRGEVSRMRRSITGLLTLARADAGSLQTAFRQIDLVDLLELHLSRWRPLFAAKGVRLHGTPPDAGELTGDSDLLGRVVDNLLDNALRVVPAGGSVEVSARRDGEHWVLAVSDTGPGVAAETVAALLDAPAGARLRPAPGRRSGDGGSGFGLALCAVIVRAHGGSIGVETSARGSVFSVRLPARLVPSGERPGDDQW